MGERIAAMIAVAILAFSGLIMLGSSITGMASSSDYTKTLCIANVDCTGTEVCCFFYEQESGVCNSESNCAGIAELTKDSSDMNQVVLPQSQNTDYMAGTIIGLIVTLACGYLIVSQYKVKQPVKKRSQKKSSS
jgi:hypothetical protein